jgi:hypothetical protein
MKANLTFSWRFRNNFASDKAAEWRSFFANTLFAQRNAGRARNPEESRPQINSTSLESGFGS